MNDRAIGFVIAVAAIFYGLTLLAEYVPKVYKWFKHRQAMKKVDAGEIPADYENVGEEQKRLNAVDSGGVFKKHMGLKHRHRSMVISSIREQVAQVRYAGYLVGEKDQLSGMLMGSVVTGNPHVTGSGAAKQWARGYCMARNVTDIKQYMDTA